MRSAQAFSAVPAPKILGRAEGNDASGIDLIMRHVIMPFDVIEIHGLGDAVILVEIFEITEEIIVIDETPEIAFEMSVVQRNASSYAFWLPAMPTWYTPLFNVSQIRAL